MASAFPLNKTELTWQVTRRLDASSNHWKLPLGSRTAILQIQHCMARGIMAGSFAALPLFGGSHEALLDSLAPCGMDHVSGGSGNERQSRHQQELRIAKCSRIRRAVRKRG